MTPESDEIEPARFVVFARRGRRACAFEAVTMLEARTLGAGRLDVTYEQTWSVIVGDGESDKAALARGRRMLTERKGQAA